MNLSIPFRRNFVSRLLRASIRRAADEQGQSLVETAFSMVLLLALIFAVIEACWGAYSLHYLANAAHDAARYAIVRGGSWGASCDPSGSPGAGYGSSMCTASPQDIANYVASRNFPGISGAAMNVCVEYSSTVPSSPTQKCFANSSPNSAGDIVQVTITYPFSLNIPFINNYTWNFASTSQMVIAQ